MVGVGIIIIIYSSISKPLNISRQINLVHYMKHNTYIPEKSARPATEPLMLLFTSTVIATAEKMYEVLQRFKPPRFPVPLEPIVIVVNGLPVSKIFREYFRTHRAEDPAEVRVTLNDWKSAFAIRLIAGADGGPRTHGKNIRLNTVQAPFELRIQFSEFSFRIEITKTLFANSLKPHVNMVLVH